jgi:L-asparaginase
LTAATLSAAETPKVHIIGTGGTIAVGRGGALSVTELLEQSPELAEIAELSSEDYLKIGSTRMTPERQLGLARRVNELFADAPELSGIVITHGTDSLEETAFLLDLLVKHARPVVLAGAMRPPRRSDTDGARNLSNAVRLAAAGVEGLGVVAVMNDEIHAARDVRKAHAIAYDAFSSPGLGPLGYFDEEHVFLARKPARRLTLDVEDIEPRVSLIKLFTGSDGSQVRAAIASDQKGIVLEVFGRGNVPPRVMAAVREARRENITVVFATRTGGGRVVLSDAAIRSGVISGQDLDGLKARLVLVAALATSSDVAELRSYFERLSGKLDE